MAIQSRKLEGKPSITIDVIKLLHAAGLSTQEIKAFTPIIKMENVKTEIGIKTIEAILNNTLSGYDKNGQKFTKYSKSYKNSTKFKIYKGGKRTVDLKLVGDMQADIEVLAISGTSVTVGFTDHDEGQKAKGHILGANHLPKRDFFGLKPVDLNKIMLDVISEYENEKEEFLEYAGEDNLQQEA